MRIKFTAGILLLMVACGCVPQNGTGQTVAVKIQKLDPDSNLPAEFFAYKDREGREVRHGPFILRYKTGAKYVVANYVHGELDGKCRVFTEEGKVELEGDYRRGLPWNGEFQVGHEIRKYGEGKFVSSRTD